MRKYAFYAESSPRTRESLFESAKERFAYWLPKLLKELHRRPSTRDRRQLICLLKKLNRSGVDARYIPSRIVQQHQADGYEIPFDLYTRSLRYSVDSTLKYGQTVSKILWSLEDTPETIDAGIRRANQLHGLRNRTATGQVTYPGVARMYHWMNKQMKNPNSIYDCLKFDAYDFF